MTRHVGLGLVNGVVILIAACPCLEVFAKAAFGQHDPVKARAAFEARERPGPQVRLPTPWPPRTGLLGYNERESIRLDGLTFQAQRHLEREDFAAAKAALQEILEILRKTHGGAYWKVTEARVALEYIDLLAGMTREQRQKLAETYQELGHIGRFVSQGNLSEGLPPALHELAVRKMLLGEHHPDYATSLNNVALLFHAQGDYAAARPRYERALAVRKEVLGERHSEYAESLYNLAYLVRSQGDYATARPLYEKLVAVREERLADRDQPKGLYAASLNDLASLLDAQGDYAAARPLYEKALAILKESSGEGGHLYTLSLNNLAHLLYSQGDYAAARPLYEKILAIEPGLRLDPLFTAVRSNLAYLVRAQGDIAAAKALNDKPAALLKSQFKVLPNVQPSERHAYATFLNNLAELYRSDGELVAAKFHYEEALAVRTELRGERPLDYAASLNNLALLLHAQGNHAAARPLYEKALAISKEVLGERNPLYLDDLSNLVVYHTCFAGSVVRSCRNLRRFVFWQGGHHGQEIPSHPGT
jgi:tetratricopeptide (TPR) repeat protein